ncbi:hypothetical protein KP509_16G000500 [Ceratopteris richardii]|uniref:C2H2-type domain-containing protein n=1 Tax=Ceratopteris richardii TaxID=49495 RepID=A0A8T2SW60_CERRI|nr:hypothetical protein KP509_16G000500 [Ceratopteris richardii]KAH7387018.1 hypothetical protein KP509_16G000500 [Ceratopteris richardii]KAH7387019.1 hypothetical protein KP509_16G000500 [Ceratopteris richardii]
MTMLNFVENMPPLLTIHSSSNSTSGNRFHNVNSRDVHQSTSMRDYGNKFPCVADGGWPAARAYGCSFCGREFSSAQALGGHMNIHRRDRARLRCTNLPDCRPSSISGVAGPNPDHKEQEKSLQRLQYIENVDSKDNVNLHETQPFQGIGHDRFYSPHNRLQMTGLQTKWSRFGDPDPNTASWTSSSTEPPFKSSTGSPDLMPFITPGTPNASDHFPRPILSLHQRHAASLLQTYGYAPSGTSYYPSTLQASACRTSNPEVPDIPVTNNLLPMDVCVSKRLTEPNPTPDIFMGERNLPLQPSNVQTIHYSSPKAEQGITSAVEKNRCLLMHHENGDSSAASSSMCAVNACCDEKQIIGMRSGSVHPYPIPNDARRSRTLTSTVKSHSPCDLELRLGL